jgi:hypothetical protein
LGVDQLRSRLEPHLRPPDLIDFSMTPNRRFRPPDIADFEG